MSESSNRPVRSGVYLPSPSISTGTITEISSDGRFGFITPDCGGIEVFFHAFNCVEGYTPRLHDHVSYLTRLSDLPGRRSCFTAKKLGFLSYGEGS